MSTDTPSKNYESLTDLMGLAVEISKIVPEIKGIVTHERNDFWFFEFTDEGLRDFITALTSKPATDDLVRDFKREVKNGEEVRFFVSEGKTRTEISEMDLLNISVWLKEKV